ncbi:MAG: hypothetical protein EHM42_14070 [Planctomycetaceae bacterium]|nr:MAG: hypothetical protein EHM42_14070 [Planctomycetaceae bacterium]
MIHVLAADFGNVLSRFSHQRASEQIAALTAGRHTADQVYTWIFKEGRLEPLEDGTLHVDDFLSQLSTRFSVDDLQALRIAYKTIFTRVVPTCDLLARVKVPKFLASNTDPLHWEEIGRMFADDFAGFVPGGLLRSFDVGSRKPAHEFFSALVDLARRKLNAPSLQAGEILFVDDLAENCAAARECGLVVHVHHNHDAAGLEAVFRAHGILNSARP